MGRHACSGGRCDTVDNSQPGYQDSNDPTLCTEGVTTAATPHEIYLTNLGQAAGGVQIDLRITNESEYRAWNERLNGVKRQYEGDREGFFGVVNLLGPRSTTQRPLDMLWNSYFTYTQLRFAFVDSLSLAPITLARTYLTFFDFDTGRASSISRTRNCADATVRSAEAAVPPLFSS